MQRLSKLIHPFVIVNQVLPNFDTHMRQTAALGMMVDAEILWRLSGIRFVVTDDDTFATQPAQEYFGNTAIAVPQDARLPRPRHTV